MSEPDKEPNDQASPAAPLPELPNGIDERIYPYITVEFKGNRREMFSNPMEFPFVIGDRVVVRVEKGEDLGQVIHLLEKLPDDRPSPEHEVLRRATSKDLKILDEYRAKESEARAICKEKIAKHGLEMKLVDVEYQFDGRKLIFYFTADGRIDFRQLVKDLAATFRTRIELKQIGARDETRRFGGLGPCGRRLCCVTFIQEFCPITTQMAKDMNLPLNPSKISGCCGRLKCCLQYELNVYRTALEVLPRWDSRLRTGKGSAFVEKLDVFDLAVYLRYDSGDLERVEAEDLMKLKNGDFQPAEPAPAQEPVSEEDEVISDDEDAECRSTVQPQPTPTMKKQRKTDKRKRYHTKQRPEQLTERGQQKRTQRKKHHQRQQRTTQKPESSGQNNHSPKPQNGKGSGNSKP